MSDHLKTAAALLPLFSVGVAGISGDDIDVALFVIGVLYFTWFGAAAAGLGGWLAFKNSRRAVRSGLRAFNERKKRAGKPRKSAERELSGEPAADVEATVDDAAEISELAAFWAIYVGVLVAIAWTVAWASVWSDDFERRSNNFGVAHVFAILLLACAALWIGSRFAPGRPPTTQTCPDCAETISAHAVKCKHCGAKIDPCSPAS